jgi:hypothetical protein
MSRTKAHRPLTVRMFDKTDKNIQYEEYHYHNNGECTLPETPDPKAIMSKPHSSPKECQYVWKYTGHGICGCDMCTGHTSRKIARRKDRHVTKKELNKIKHEAPEKE